MFCDKNSVSWLFIMNLVSPKIPLEGIIVKLEPIIFLLNNHLIYIVYK